MRILDFIVSKPHMVVKCTADTKRYIDNKIAALVGG